MLRSVFFLTLFLSFNMNSSTAQISTDSVFENGTIEHILEALESEMNRTRYGDTDNLKRQLSDLEEQSPVYLARLSGELYNRITKFNYAYVSDDAQTVLARSQAYYEAEAHLKSAKFYTLADFMRRKEFISTENNLKDDLQKAQKSYDSGNYADTQNYLDEAEKVIAQNTVFNKYRSELNRLQNKNKTKLLDNTSTNFYTMDGLFSVKIDLVHGFITGHATDMKVKHRPLGHRRTDISHEVSFTNAESEKVYGVSVTGSYRIHPAVRLNATAQIFPVIETTGQVNYPDDSIESEEYSFQTQLIDVQLGASYYVFQSEKFQMYGKAGAGIVSGSMSDQKDLDNQIQNALQFGDLYHAEDSFMYPALSGALGVDLLPFYGQAYLNAQAKFTKYLEVDEAAPESMVSLSLGLGWFF